MKVVIFAGGIGSRISEESFLKPKPLIEIGDKPMLWHIMKIFSAQGFNEFVICLGYKGHLIKEYFANYFINNSDLTVDVAKNKIQIHQSSSEQFIVTLAQTGMETKTAGRLKRVQEYLGNEKFFLTYGDGLADLDLHALIAFHDQHKKTATVTAVQPEGRFGGIEMNEEGKVLSFKEKPVGDGHWINGGFFVLNPDVFSYLDEKADEQMWEEEPILKLEHAQQLMAFKHHGFWRCMDAMRDKVVLEEMWNSGAAKWKMW
ncbi:MAG TPA: glucose-1-phosphate cytidylyltransferase [Chitinophagales bacterium]|nr:glucose-1-phosphate cytidylyltransferase [Chitinophagales bacterium]